MRKNLLFAVAFMLGGAWYTSAQTQIVNGNMEAWDNAGTANQEPQQWNSFKTGNCTLIIGCSSAQEQRVERSTDIRPGSTGTYSARIYSTSVFTGAVANGNMTTGQIQIGNTTPSNAANHNKTVRSNANFRMPLTASPDSIIFWAKFQPAGGSTTDEARMRAVVHSDFDYKDPSDANSAQQLVAEATVNFPRTYVGSSYVWKRFAIPFTYTGPATTPYYILVTFTTNKTPGGGTANDQVWVDDIELKYIPVTTTASTINPLSYNVSATTGASISIPFTKTGTFATGNVFTAQLSDAGGSFTTPTTLGTLTSTAAGTINGTIPAGTPSGTGYRVRVIASTSNPTVNANTSDITINLVSASIAPTTAQTIAANTNGTALTVTESITSTSREWKYATVSGGPYTTFSPAQNGTTYVPNFVNDGTYFVVCESTFGSIVTRSNEVTINVVKNQIAPAGTQSLIIGAAGTTLTVTESPAGTSREWLYSTTVGGPYLPFGTAETGTTYTPLFNTSGTYYVVCRSVINGVNVTSNEVTISVGNINITTGSIAGSPFEFSASAPNATVSVPYTVSSSFNAGNTFTAQLSDANGSFAAPTTIGTFASTTSGTINATIPSNTPDGTAYLIRVIGSNPSTLGSDNGTALTVDQFDNAVTPSADQTFVYTGTGSTLTVAESQNSVSREWKVSNTSGGTYTAIPGETATTYTPSFSTPGIYYVVCASTNQYSDEVVSNEVLITATNANSISTSTVAGSPFYVSPSANNQISVNFTSDVIFNSGNVFTAQLSNESGNFIAPVTIGTLAATSPATISATIPNVILDGAAYRIRVISSSPAITGTDNGTNLQMINFAVSAAPVDTQYIGIGVNCAPINLQSTHPGTTAEWKFRTAFFGSFLSFNPPVNGTSFVHSFSNANTYQIMAKAHNNWGDTLETQVVIIKVGSVGINESAANEGVKAFISNDQFVVDLTNASFQNPQLVLVNMAGQVVYTSQLQGQAVHTLPISLASGIYTYRISENGKFVSGKIPVL